MWSNKQDENEHGERVLLLDPITNKSSSKSQHINNTVPPNESMIGGYPSFSTRDEYFNQYQKKKCSLCHEPLHLISQLYAPLEDRHLERTMYIYGCNKASCVQSLFRNENNQDDSDNEKSFHLGGEGILCCIRSQWYQANKRGDDNDITTMEAPQEKITSTSTTNIGWGDDDMENKSLGGWGDGDDDNDWLDTNETNNEARMSSPNTSMNDLEEMLAAMEATTSTTNSTTDKNKPSSKKKKKALIDVYNCENEDTSNLADYNTPHNSPSFPSYQLELYEEPPKINKCRSTTGGNEDDQYDDDDEHVGLASDVDNARIQKLLSNYLKDEEDEDILDAITSNNASVSTENIGNGGGNGEKFERLNPKDRAFFNFTDRIKRSPNQVIRYAYGGVPIWSIPTPRNNIPKKLNSDNRYRSHQEYPRPLVPPCPCGSKREFEFQLMPSTLHILDVDNHCSIQTPKNNHTNPDNQFELMMNRNQGGMNWGCIAAYSCAASCDEYRDEFLVIQNSLDEAPQRKDHNGIINDDE